MLTRTRAVVLAVAGLSLAACGTVHPGSAAVVDGRTISMDTLDRTASAYCTLTAQAARAQGITTVSNAEVRRQAVVGLVSLRVARDLAASHDITIGPSSYELTAQQRDELSKSFPGADLDELAQAIEDSREVSAIAVALAEKKTNQQATTENEAQFAELGQSEILAGFAARDVSFAPRFGLDSKGEQRAATGSVSVTPVDPESPVDEELPASQRCS
ncbi:hypothetical protein [Aeromicrobium fastidiosum]|uniref:SurA N-terminal domain-containing protein n=1 Tax=Aeromicrobium fastidiosum TaxID=52699 RepID=A0A641ALE6_9ACTN|nr:hypothetical protein [Aeromicrobium fastidiosum]KAA1378104.1 hypothetical protein ESP62_006880 [Aeromicrobium fastidiosum]MBP2389100.1 hypothetical protein [Aeromicrobium fastidiosum]